MTMTTTCCSPRPPSRGDRGSSTLEMVVIFPALMLLIFGIIQGGWWYHARNVALAAATSGLQATSAQTGTTGTGQEAAGSFLSRAGGSNVLTGIQIQATRTQTTATVTVTGQALSFIPGVPGLRVTQSATGPVERYTTAGGT